MQWVGDHDFMFRYLTLNTLPFFQKNWTESWKRCYARNVHTDKHFTKEKFNYSMCPIRQFKTPVVALDSFFNFVVACDKPGILKIFLIDENDLENDDESLAIRQVDLGAPAHFLKIMADKQFDYQKEA